MGADASGPPRFGAGAVHLDVGHAVSQRDLWFMDFFRALNTGADNGALSAGIAPPSTPDEHAVFLERGPASDLNEEILVEFEHSSNRFRLSQ